MFRSNDDYAGLLTCPDPYSTCPTDERERTVADELSRTGDLKHDRIIRDGTNAAKLIRHAQEWRPANAIAFSYPCRSLTATWMGM